MFIACPRCEALLVAGDKAALCPAGHAYPALRTGYDLRVDAREVHYPSTAIDRLLRMHREHFWFVSRRLLVVSWALKYGAPGETFLDLGAGCGDMSVALRKAGFQTIAADYHPAGGEALRALDEAIPFHSVDAYRVPFRDLDGMGMFDVLEHLDDPVEALRQAARALKPGGWLLISVPARRELWSNVDLYSGHRLRYDKRTLRKHVGEAGLTTVRATYFMLPLALPLLWSRRLGSWRMSSTLTETEVQATFDNLAEIPPPIVNRMAMGVLAIERAWLRGANLPYGSSLLALVRRDPT
jgi:SAM-dependent methyltransferase